MSTPLPILDDADFRAVVSARAGSLLGAAARLAEVGPDETETALAVLCRPLLSEMLSQAVQLEELLDAYGALRNERWRPFRNRVAAMKLFARVHYSWVHLAHAFPHYQCVPVDGDLAAALLEGKRFTAQVLHLVSRKLLEAAAGLDLTPAKLAVCEERLPAGLLPQDRPLRHVADVAGTVARLATAFLNLAEEAGGLSRPPPDLPEEAELRRLSEDFHNLQALYDTHVAHTDVERDDPQIRALRGHASTVFHLLEIATELTHFHERHVLHAAPAADGNGLLTAPYGIGPERLEGVLHGCALAYAGRYVAAGRSFAQQLLRRYAEQGEITVAVPRYRGFHVRPSTLVARVTYHYGSPVTMTLDEETYDAASPLDLFRANERINARKRRWLAKEIARIMEDPSAKEWLQEGVSAASREVVMRLADEAKVIVYEHPLQPVESACEPCEGQPLISFVVDAVARLQALGKLDIVTAVHATFRGDRRVLADIEKLAGSGYGEDAYGNNIALPEELRYLRR
jgi:hypothetical protein